MTDRPILFSAPMVLALLGGRKTQTRRLLRMRGHKSFSQFGPSDTKGYDWHFRDSHLRWHDLRHSELLARLPWAVGDRLWVRETWACHWATDDQAPAAIDPKAWSARYLADGFIRPAFSDGSEALADQFRKTRVSIHMPRWASRVTLTVTDVRVQRLQEISEEDAQAEGVEREIFPPAWPTMYERAYWKGYENHKAAHRDTAVGSFSSLWTSIHGPGAWDANPEVVAISFRCEHRNIDAVAA